MVGVLVAAAASLAAMRVVMWGSFAAVRVLSGSRVGCQRTCRQGMPYRRRPT
jgi:hypothetical protein